MSTLSSVLPFLAALKKNTPDFSGMTSDTPSLSDQAAQAQAMQNAPVAPTPDLSVPNAQPQMPPQDLTDTAQGKAATPKLSKGTQLMMILQRGIMGGLQGMEQNAQTYAATGRNAGFGGGLAGGMQLPMFMQQSQANQLAQQRAQTQLLQQQAQQINIPGYGSMPTGLAKVLFPSLIGAQAKTQAATIGAQGRIGAAQVGKSVVIVPGKGAFEKDENGKYNPIEGAQIPNVLVTPEEAQAMGHPELGNQEIPMTNYAQMLRGTAFGSVVTQGAQGPALVQRNPASPNYGKVTQLGLGSPAMAGITVVADPNSPGNVTYAPKTAAVGAMAPQAAPAVTARQTARAIAPGGKVGEEINAFNTAMQHAELLKQAATALNNGDVRALNGVKNRLATQFGDPDITNFDAISHVYQNEIQKMIAGGHITNQEITTNSATLPSNANYKTISRVLDSYKALAASKLQMRQQQVQAGQKGQANFPSGSIQVTDPAGGIHTFPDQKSADAFKAAIGIK